MRNTFPGLSNLFRSPYALSVISRWSSEASTTGQQNATSPLAPNGDAAHSLRMLRPRSGSTYIHFFPIHRCAARPVANCLDPFGIVETRLPSSGFDVWEADGGVRTHFGFVLQFWQED
ncbi:hypothetical protein Pla100_03820 [Neorhodopirellula pilleata]|uniref:Uncharacterized protein n=1 Tax=Neorhodopirellula pilleata TaxID=2714738 RepID=A0A5C6ATY4_9BACT|nr:hypothetical protein Pla100_03820 [Neorhodopirellula pilleata]